MLYHYTTFAAFDGIIRCAELRLNNILNMNDASEMRLFMNGICEAVTERLARSGQMDKSQEVEDFFQKEMEEEKKKAQKEIEAEKKRAERELEKQKEKLTKSLTVDVGDWSSDVSRKLQTLGIVKDAKDFDKYLNDNGFSSSISAGTYKVSVGDTYNELARKITKR